MILVLTCFQESSHLDDRHWYQWRRYSDKNYLYYTPENKIDLMLSPEVEKYFNFNIDHEVIGNFWCSSTQQQKYYKSYKKK